MQVTPLTALQYHFINLHCLVVFCIVDFLLGGIKRNIEIHAPWHTITEYIQAPCSWQTWKLCISVTSIAFWKGWRQQVIHTLQHHLQNPGQVPPLSCLCPNDSQISVSNPDFASGLQACLSNFFLAISTDCSKINIFKTEFMISLFLSPPNSRLCSWWNRPATVQPTIIRDHLSLNNFPIESPNLSVNISWLWLPFPSTNPTNICLLLLSVFNSKVERLKHSSSESISRALSASSFINDPEKKRTNVNSWWVLMIQNYVASWGQGQRAGKIHHDLDQLSNWADTWPIKCVRGKR